MASVVRSVICEWLELDDLQAEISSEHIFDASSAAPPPTRKKSYGVGLLAKLRQQVAHDHIERPALLISGGGIEDVMALLAKVIRGPSKLFLVAGVAANAAGDIDPHEILLAQ